jgi:hypothetical protein
MRRVAPAMVLILLPFAVLTLVRLFRCQSLSSSGFSGVLLCDSAVIHANVKKRASPLCPHPPLCTVVDQHPGQSPPQW